MNLLQFMLLLIKFYIFLQLDPKKRSGFSVESYSFQNALLSTSMCSWKIAIYSIMLSRYIFKERRNSLDFFRTFQVLFQEFFGLGSFTLLQICYSELALNGTGIIFFPVVFWCYMCSIQRHLKSKLGQGVDSQEAKIQQLQVIIFDCLVRCGNRSGDLVS